MTASVLGILALAALTQVSEPTGLQAIMESLLFGFEMAPAARTSGLSAQAELSLVRYREREAQFKPTIILPGDLGGDSPEDTMYRKHVGVERTVFSLFARSNSQSLALEFATEIELGYEWEGMADGPLDEAASAEAFLARRRNSPIAPYVHLFSGHRKLCAISYTRADPKTAEARRIARDADQHLRLARDSGYPLIRVVAQYLLTTRKCTER